MTFSQMHKNDYCSRFDSCVVEMLRDLKLQPLQQRRLESRLVMMYKIVRGMVPAINADEVFIPIRNKRQIKSKSHQDCYSLNIISKYALNYLECYKVPASNTDQHKNSYFVKTTSDWNCLSDTHIRAETVNSFKTAVHTYVTSQYVAHTSTVNVPEVIPPFNIYRYRYRPACGCEMRQLSGRQTK